MDDFQQVEAQLAGISFSDARIESVVLEAGDTRITVQDWQGRLIPLHFTGVVYFKASEFGSDLSEVLVSHATPEIDEARRIQTRDGVADAEALALTQVSFVSDNPVVIVVVRDFANTV